MTRKTPIVRKTIHVVSLFPEFLKGERAGGLLLILATVLSLFLSNLVVGDGYVRFWHHPLGLTTSGLTLPDSPIDWINDGLMAIFFLLVGLEIEREIYIGKLSSPGKALLPVIAAVGGMAAPALIHFSLNHGTPTQPGFGTPVATDIAFSLGLMSFVGRRVPLSLKVLLTALAIIDDLGAIVVIALFYAGELSLVSLGVAFALLGLMILLNRWGVDRLPVYVVLGVVMWVFMENSGIHPTITGVLLAFAIPFRQGRDDSPSCRMQRILDIPVPLVILPLFALANTAIVFPGQWHVHLIEWNQAGIMAGLFLGKPIGIILAVFLAVKTGLSTLPPGVAWRHVAGMGLLCGIGFTMSIFIATLAFTDAALVQDSKIAILLGSGLSAVAGISMLALTSSGEGERPDQKNRLKSLFLI